MSILFAGRRHRLVLCLLLGSLLLIGSCGREQVSFHYPGEVVRFAVPDSLRARIFIDLVQDLRPARQRLGEGHFLGITFPSDEAWDMPVHEIYRQALVQDLTQTEMVEVVPLARQADYTLTAGLLSFGARLQRNAASFLLPLAAGAGVGLAFGEDSSDRIKTGTVAAVAALLAIPLPSSLRAECEVRLTLQDRQGRTVWERSCLGLVEDTVYLGITARDDQRFANEQLPRAVKRCNACLFGQLRSFLVQPTE
jgi:hypothetical protein